MRLNKLAALAAASLIITSGPAAAQSAGAPSQAAAPARTGAEMDSANKLEGEGVRVYLIGLVALAALAYLVLQVVGGSDDEPASP